jgi:hypothetical protein
LVSKINTGSPCRQQIEVPLKKRQVNVEKRKQEHKRRNFQEVNKQNDVVVVPNALPNRHVVAPKEGFFLFLMAVLTQRKKWQLKIDILVMPNSNHTMKITSNACSVPVSYQKTSTERPGCASIFISNGFPLFALI